VVQYSDINIVIVEEVINVTVADSATINIAAVNEDPIKVTV